MTDEVTQPPSNDEPADHVADDTMSFSESRLDRDTTDVEKSGDMIHIVTARRTCVPISNKNCIAQVQEELTKHGVLAEDANVMILKARPVLLPLRSETAPVQPTGTDTLSSASISKDGTVIGKVIWLDGQPYRLTRRLRELLEFIMKKPATPVNDIISGLTFTDRSHFDKTLHVLRTRLVKELKDKPRSLVLALDGEATLTWKWVERPPLT